MARPLYLRSREKLIASVRWMLRFVGFIGLVCLSAAGARADVTISTGKLSEEVVDYTTGGDDQLAFIRYFYSLGPQYFGPLAPLGVNWRSNYSRRLVFITNPAIIVFEEANGDVVRFKIADGIGTSDDNTDLTLRKSDDTWVLKDKDGTETSFGPPDSSDRAHIATIKAPNGYTQTLSYNPQYQLTAVTDSHGRTLTFTYTGSALNTLTTPDGLVLSYTFDSKSAMRDYRLASMHYSTGDQEKSRSYAYENPMFDSLLTGVLDGTGKRLAAWTYDRYGRCISSEHAGGADLTKIRYDIDEDNNPINTVTNALGDTTVYKFKKFQDVPKIVEIDRVASAARPATTVTFTYDANGHLINETDAATTDPFRPQFKSP
jgi:YD repeat-containing protein